MSSDMMSSQISKDMPKSPAAAEAVNRAPVESTRQTSVPNSGKSLPPEETNALSNEELKAAVEELNKHIQQIQRDLQFSVDESSGRTVITVLNSETEEVVRQIPSEEVLRIMRNLREQMDNSVAGIIFETSA